MGPKRLFFDYGGCVEVGGAVCSPWNSAQTVHPEWSGDAFRVFYNNSGLITSRAKLSCEYAIPWEHIAQNGVVDEELTAENGRKKNVFHSSREYDSSLHPGGFIKPVLLCFRYGQLSIGSIIAIDVSCHGSAAKRAGDESTSPAGVTYLLMYYAFASNHTVSRWWYVVYL